MVLSRSILWPSDAAAEFLRKEVLIMELEK